MSKRFGPSFSSHRQRTRGLCISQSVEIDLLHILSTVFGHAGSVFHTRTPAATGVGSQSPKSPNACTYIKALSFCTPKNECIQKIDLGLPYSPQNCALWSDAPRTYENFRLIRCNIELRRRLYCIRVLIRWPDRDRFPVIFLQHVSLASTPK
jgi:hypothetical protein